MSKNCMDVIARYLGFYKKQVDFLIYFTNYKML